MAENKLKTEKDFTQNLKTFERQPTVTKELQMLEDHSEKSIGKTMLIADKLIQSKAKDTPVTTGL